MARWTAPFRNALIAWYHRDQRSRARSRNLATLFGALPRWEQAIILAPALLWIGNFVFYAWEDGFQSVRTLLIDLAATVCPFMSFNALCSIGAGSFLAQSKFYGLQLVSLSFLTAALTLLLIVIQLARAALRIPAATVCATRRDWIFAAILLAVFHTGLLIFDGARIGLKGTLTVASLGCVSLFYVRVILSPLIRSDDSATPTGPQPVVRRLR